jgi:hypothetical protein
VVLRLILFPWLVLFYTREYIRFSTDVQTYFNLVLITPVLHSVVTAMSIMWTIEMFKKQFFGKAAKQAEKEKKP